MATKFYFKGSQQPNSDKLRTHIVQGFWYSLRLKGHTAGWGNGYVLIPQGHFLYGKCYDDIHVDVHGGLTFSE